MSERIDKRSTAEIFAEVEALMDDLRDVLDASDQPWSERAEWWRLEAERYERIAELWDELWKSACDERAADWARRAALRTRSSYRDKAEDAREREAKWRARAGQS